MPKPRVPSLPLLALPLALVACGDGAPGRVDRSGPEVLQNASGALREADIRATLDGATVELAFPIQKLERGTLKGTLDVRLVDAGAETPVELASGQLALSQIGELQTHRLVLSGLPADLERARTAALVVDWAAALPDGSLRGKRSLYAALGRLEVQVRGATEVPAEGEAPLRVIARDPETLAPAVGAEVVARLEHDGGEAELGRGQTDARGELATRIRLPAGIESGTLRVLVRHDGAEAWARASLRAVRDQALFLSSDKTIYKPGQQVELRLLALARGTKAPLADTAVVFEALDAKGNKVWKRRTTTDAFGVAAAAAPIDARVNEGDWTFRAIVGEENTQKKIPVQRYNLPKLKIEVAAERSFVRPGDDVDGVITARYLFGRPVREGEVQVRATTSDGNVLATATGRTDADGLYRYRLSVPAGYSSPSLDDGLGLAIEATVTDPAGQAESGQLALPFVREALVLRAVAEAGVLLPGARNVVLITVTDPAGRPIAAAVDASVGGTRYPLETGADGLAELSFLADGDASLDIDLTATDGAARSVRRRLSLTAAPDRLVVRSDRALYRAGETAELELLAPAGVSRAFVDVYRGAEGVASLELALVDGVGRVSLPITPAMRGALLVDAFALGEAGEVLRGARRALVDPEDRLDLVVSPGRAQVSPGDETELTVTARGPDGRPAVAAIGLTVVDEAAFALGGEPDDDVRAFFDVDPRVLPADLSALGRRPADLLSGAGDPALQDAARLLLARAPAPGALGFEFNSVREERPQIVTLMQTRARRDAVAMLKSISPIARRDGLEGARLGSLVLARARALVDPFGRPYEVEVRADRGQLVMTTSGPDERAGTGDDGRVELWYEWIRWTDDVDADGGFEGGGGGGGPARGGVADEAAQAGQPAPPPGPNAPTTTGGQSPAAGVKVRADFRETVLARPMLITDASGRATVRFPVADSITTWRASAMGSTREGALGSARARFTTFQEFFLDFDVPTTLTAGDEIELPAIVYNYLPTAQDVAVSLELGEGLSLLSSGTETVRLGPSEVRAVRFRIRADTAGERSFTLRGLAGGVGDALVRIARVAPDGEPLDQTIADKLTAPITHTISVPADAVENGTRVTVTLTPGFASEAVAGTEALLHEPTGCFEQTTSTAWPNTMVVTYLDATGQATPELRERGFDLVTRGYQRLLTFESPTGGFNWWGDADPGNRILSAIMLWHLKDMESIIEIDAAVRDRTLAWLVDQQRADGSWASGDALHSGNEVLGENELRTTAFIAWALAHTGWADASVDRAVAWIESHRDDADDLYTTALASNALAITRPSGAAAQALLARLDRQKEEAGEGKTKWPTTAPSWTGAGGDAAAIETTGLVAYGLIRANARPDLAAGAVRFVVANKDAVGTWYNTQATMNALRALLAAASPTGSDAEGTLSVTVNGTALAPIALTRENGDLVQEIDITEHVAAGDNTVTLSFAGQGEPTYRVTRRSFVPALPPPASGPFELTVVPSTTEPSVGEPVELDVTARYTGPGQRDQVIVQLGRAPGFSPRIEDLEALVASGAIARYDVRESDVTLYLMGLRSMEARALRVGFLPTLAVAAQAPGAAIYAYYEPTLRADLAPIDFVVTE